MANPDDNTGPAADVALAKASPATLPPREQAWLLLIQYSTLPSTFARQVTSASGLALAERTLQVSDEQIGALLAAGKLQPPGPHVEAAWREIEAGFPPPPKPKPKPQPQP